MNIANFPLGFRAFVAYNELSKDEQARIQQELLGLEHRSRQEWPSDRLRLLNKHKGLFAFSIDDSLRAVVRWPEQNRPEIVDILRQETLMP
jgi:hypothetical protein